MNTAPETPYGPMVTAMVTPFTADGAVDYGRTEELTAHLIANGTSALVVCGTTGESPTLTPAEKVELFRTVRRAAGKTPVIANTGDNETAFSIELSRQAQECGVDALLLVVPYYNRPNQEGLYQHFKAIAGAVDLPCLLYNVPSRTARNLEAKTTARLSEVKNIVGIKEATGDMVQMAHLRASTPREFLIYSGDDAATLPMLLLGGCGVISVLSHIAGPLFRQMMESFWDGDIVTARDHHLKLLPVIEALFPANTPSPAPVKAALQLQGFDCGGLRLPLVEVTEPERETLRRVMQQAGLL